MPSNSEKSAKSNQIQQKFDIAIYKLDEIMKNYPETNKSKHPRYPIQFHFEKPPKSKKKRKERRIIKEGKLNHLHIKSINPIDFSNPNAVKELFPESYQDEEKQKAFKDLKLLCKNPRLVNDKILRDYIDGFLNAYNLFEEYCKDVIPILTNCEYKFKIRKLKTKLESIFGEQIENISDEDFEWLLEYSKVRNIWDHHGGLVDNDFINQSKVFSKYFKKGEIFWIKPIFFEHFTLIVKIAIKKIYELASNYVN